MNELMVIFIAVFAGICLGLMISFASYLICRMMDKLDIRREP